MAVKTIAVLGAGPGLGMSVARRFGAEGYATALVSRGAARHESYRAGLAAEGIDATSYVADLTDPEAVRHVVARITKDLGGIDAVYFGPAAVGPRGIVALPDADADAIREPLDTMLIPAATLIAAVLPGMLARNDGVVLLPTGLSGLRPMPALGTLAPASAALRMYSLTLNAALADRGVYVGTLTIGGLIARGDIHALLTEGGRRSMPSLNPDDIAETAWTMATDRGVAEAVFEAPAS
jgi:NAD(P)-dependent dehydrogenase (short-subunit alcohol dehydrogenase family)